MAKFGKNKCLLSCWPLHCSIDFSSFFSKRKWTVSSSNSWWICRFAKHRGKAFASMSNWTRSIRSYLSYYPALGMHSSSWTSLYLVFWMSPDRNSNSIILTYFSHNDKAFVSPRDLSIIQYYASRAAIVCHTLGIVLCNGKQLGDCHTGSNGLRGSSGPPWHVEWAAWKSHGDCQPLDHQSGWTGRRPARNTWWGSVYSSGEPRMREPPGNPRRTCLRASPEPSRGKPRPLRGLAFVEMGPENRASPSSSISH